MEFPKLGVDRFLRARNCSSSRSTKMIGFAYEFSKVIVIAIGNQEYVKYTIAAYKAQKPNLNAIDERDPDTALQQFTFP